MHTAPTFYIHEDILFLIHYFYIGILELILIFIYDSYDSLVHEYTSSYYAYSSTTLVASNRSMWTSVRRMHTPEDFT